MSRSIETSIAIAASAERAWDVLTDFADYHEWNPFLTEVIGSPEVGRRLRVRFRGADGRQFRFRAKVLVAEPGRKLEWVRRAGLPGIFDGHHRFVITPIDADHCRLDHGEWFRGLLVAPTWRFIAAENRDGFRAMNEALAARCAA